MLVGYDGGALYVSVNNGAWNHNVNYANGTNWYDGQTSFGGTTIDIWDGSQAGSIFSRSSTSVSWMNMSYDVSNLSGNNVSSKHEMSDSIISDAGWYVDDIGLEVDWFNRREVSTLDYSS